MSYLLLTAIVLTTLVVARLFTRAAPPYAELARRLNVSGAASYVIQIVVLIGLPLGFILGAQLGAVAAIAAAVIFWMLSIAFLILFAQHFRPELALTIAGILTILGVILVQMTGSTGLNSVLLVYGIIGTAWLLARSGRITERIWYILFAAIMLVDAIFVWAVDIIPRAVESMKPEVFALLIRSGDLVIGAGDLAVLVIGFFLLTKTASRWASLVIAAALSANILIVYALDVLGLRGEAFPFTVVAVPMIMLFHFVQHKTALR